LTERPALIIDYHGLITTGTIGFFAMDYDSPAGKRRTINSESVLIQNDGLGR